MACCISLLQSDTPSEERLIRGRHAGSGSRRRPHCLRPPELVNQSDSSTGHHPEDSQGDGAPDAPFRGDVTEPFILANIADGKVAELGLYVGHGRVAGARPAAWPPQWRWLKLFPVFPRKPGTCDISDTEIYYSILRGSSGRTQGHCGEQRPRHERSYRASLTRDHQKELT